MSILFGGRPSLLPNPINRKTITTQRKPSQFPVGSGVYSNIAPTDGQMIGLTPYVAPGARQVAPTMPSAASAYTAPSARAGLPAQRKPAAVPSMPSMSSAYARGMMPKVGQLKQDSQTDILRALYSGQAPGLSSALRSAAATGLQLSGYQDRPMTTGQILGAMLQAGSEDYKAFSASEAERKRYEEQKAKEEARYTAQIARDEARYLTEQERLAAEAAEQIRQFNVRLTQAKDEAQERLDAANAESARRLKAALNSETHDVTIDGVQGTAEVAFLDLDDPRISLLGGDPVTGRVIIPNTFKAEEVEAEEASGREGYVMQDGVLIGYGVEGDYTKYIPLKGGKAELVPEGANTVDSEFLLKSTMTRNQFDNLEKEINDQLRAREALTAYQETTEARREGFGLIADKFIANVKTLSGPALREFMNLGNLTDSQLAARLAEGQLNALLGQLRLETVGGGVMTEQDALRIISRLGGNVDAFANKQAVLEAINEVLASKDALIEDQVNRYNAAVDSRYTLIGAKKKNFRALVPSDDFDDIMARNS